MDNKYEFTAHECGKQEQFWTYACKYRLTPKVRCPAKAKVVKFEDKWILNYATENNKCEHNRAQVTAKQLKQNMKDIVKKN